MNDAVGPVLNMCGELDGVIEAIRDDNEDRDVEVVDCGGYVRVRAPGFLRVTSASLQRHLGESYEIRALESIMSSFAGRIRTTSDEIHWYLAGQRSATPAP